MYREDEEAEADEQRKDDKAKALCMVAGLAVVTINVVIAIFAIAIIAVINLR